MRTAEGAERWAATWKRAWEALDAEAIVGLYAPDALLSTEPFREPYAGRDGVRAYVGRVFAEEEDPQVHVGAPIVEGARAAVPWWASLREDGVDTTLAGVSILRFDDAGLVTEQWDAWNVVRERRPPPEAWGPFAAPIT
jgi:ketosteroid isomerase-like protein